MLWQIKMDVQNEQQTKKSSKWQQSCRWGMIGIRICYKRTAVMSAVNARDESRLCCCWRMCLQNVTQKWRWMPAWQMMCREPWELWQYVFSVGRRLLASLRMGSEIGNTVCLPHSHVRTYCTTANEPTLIHTHTHTNAVAFSFAPFMQKLIKPWVDFTAFVLVSQKRWEWVRLTVEDFDSDRLLLLDGLCVWEAGVADVVIPGVLSAYIREVQVTVKRLGHPLALRQPLKVWNVWLFKYTYITIIWNIQSSV